MTEVASAQREQNNETALLYSCEELSFLHHGSKRHRLVEAPHLHAGYRQARISAGKDIDV